MDYGALTAARLRSGQWLHWGIRFFLAAALTASETVDGYAPFALGCIAAAGPGADGAAAAAPALRRAAQARSPTWEIKGKNGMRMTRFRILWDECWIVENQSSVWVTRPSNLNRCAFAKR